MAPFNPLAYPAAMLRVGNRRYLFGFLAATAIMIAVGLSIMVATQRFRDAVRRVERSQQTIGLIAQVRARLHDGIATQRSYLLIADPTLRSEYAEARPAIHRDLARLASLSMDDALQSDGVDRLARIIEARLDAADEGIRILDADGLAAVQAQLRSNKGRRLLQQIESVAGAMAERERARLRENGEAATRSANVLLALGALGIPLSLALVWWIFALLSREVRHRVYAEARLGAANERLEHSVSDLERAGADLAELGRYASHLQGCRSVQEAMDATRQALLTLLPRCAGSVYLLRASGDYAEAATQWGQSATPHKPLLQPPDCWALRRSKPYRVDDLRRGTACGHYEAPTTQEAVASACFPLGAQNLLLGVLALSQDGPGPIDRVDIASAVAEQLSLALANLRLQESLRQQSIRDPLTGLFNRRYLEESLARELSRCDRIGQPLALLMLDLDHFKALNDSQGHEAGDRVLAAFGQLLQASCRREDIACRYGGEEFTIILPEIDRQAALQRAEEIREATAHLVVRHHDRRIGPVTVSIGVAMYPLQGKDGTQLREAADRALYRAKHAGRDRVEIA
jgi:diguanylate cyclase (GGDEF)-like protein